MLRALRLENFRSFADSGRIELSDLNVFIGPNSAGKSNIMTVIELALRSEISSRAPLPLDEMPSFASFASVLRRNGGARARRPSELSITFEMGEDNPARAERVRSRRYVLREGSSSGAPFVHRAELGPTTPIRTNTSSRRSTRAAKSIASWRRPSSWHLSSVSLPGR